MQAVTDVGQGPAYHLLCEKTTRRKNLWFSKNKYPTPVQVNIFTVFFVWKVTFNITNVQAIREQYNAAKRYEIFWWLLFYIYCKSAYWIILEHNKTYPHTNFSGCHSVTQEEGVKVSVLGQYIIFLSLLISADKYSWLLQSCLTLE